MLWGGGSASDAVISNLHVSALRLAMDKDIHAHLLLLLDGVLHVLVDMLLVLCLGELALLELQACTANFCKHPAGCHQPEMAGLRICTPAIICMSITDMFAKNVFAKDFVLPADLDEFIT